MTDLQRELATRENGGYEEIAKLFAVNPGKTQAKTREAETLGPLQLNFTISIFSATQIDFF